MARIDSAQRRLICKLVYYGPGGAGKTTNLRAVHARAPAERRGKPVALAAEGDQAVIFDLLPLELGVVQGFSVTQRLYTVPGRPRCAADRRRILVGVDGVVFVADSDPTRLRDAVSSYEELLDQLRAVGKDPARTPLVLQYNKRDLPHALPADDMDRVLNARGDPAFEAVATEGRGVLETLRALSRLVLSRCREELALPADDAIAHEEPPLGLSSAEEGPGGGRAFGSSPPPSETVVPLTHDSTAAWDETGLPQLAPEHRVGDVVGGCVILAKLGEGGMGTAYLARVRSQPSETVVVKTLKPGREATERRVRRFFREARSAARLDHENVVRVREVGTDERGIHYMIMQHVRGTDLKQYVLRRGPLEPYEAARIVLEVARGLDATHRAGVIHRDVKPDNVVIGESGDVKLIDFGLSRDLRWEEEGGRPGRGLVGTIMYMAPERFLGRPADARSDIFSLGLTFYFLLTARLPYSGCKAAEVVAGLARLVPPHAAVPDLPDRVRRVLERMLARQPEDRYPSAAALARDLEALWSKRGPSAPRCGRLWLWDRDPSELGAVEDPSQERGVALPEGAEKETPLPPVDAISESGYGREVLAALEAWDALPEEAASESSDELERLIDAAWSEDAPRVWGGAVRGAGLRGGAARPERLLDASWRSDLEDALRQLEAAPVAEHQRLRLSRDPGQAEINALLSARGRSDRRRLRKRRAAGAGGRARELTRRGIASARAGDLEGAVVAYGQALAADPGYLPALANRASARFHLRRYAECEEDCTRALAVAPRLAKAWLFRGISRALLGRPGAREDMLRFLKLSPYSPYVRYIRALLRQTEAEEAP